VSRSTGLLDLFDPALRRTDNLVWLRVEGERPDDPLVHVWAPPQIRPGPRGGALS
jgi:hypothetical protein